ncbi:MAG TPA: O-antigen ligase family protein [Opitutaceae bacterium]
MIIGGACLLAVWIGGALADGSVGLAAMAAVISGSLVLIWSRCLRLETALLAFVLAGYLIGNRGFAQIMPFPGLPLLFGEIVLAITGLIVAVQSAFRRELPWKNDRLNGILLLIITLGVARMVLDVRTFGFWAVRDFATIYYIAYFFVAQAVTTDDRERHRLETLFLGAAAVLPVIALLFQRFPDFFGTTLTLSGIPVIFMKDDLAATFLLAGLFPLLARAGSLSARWWRAGAAAAALLVGLALLSRAAIVGFAVAGTFALLGRQLAWVKIALIALPLGLAATIGTSLVQDVPLRDSRGYALYEHLISIADLDGSGRYESTASTDSGDNNRFRVVWWQSITARVLEENPVFGLGFGYDLARDFVSTYEGVGDDFAVRSPHSIVFTILGRTGFFGLTLFLTLVAVMLGRTHTAAKAARAQLDGAARALSWWCACWVILISACFGVVLENPMGAVVFWILLGLAHASTKAVTEAAAAMKSAESHDPSLQTESEPAIR